jgi:pimeloyl-ACP methyl ester carboxylesterase
VQSTELAPRVLVLGWHGSTERNLRAIARVWQSLGAETETFVPDTWRGMSRRTGWSEVGAELASRVAVLHRRDPRPLILHAFSNAGFWTMIAYLEAVESAHPELASAHRMTLIDSAPGFPEKVKARFTAKYASMAMAPALLSVLGRRPRHRHWLLTPPLQLFLGFWHLISPEQVRFMESSQARFLSLTAGKPLVVLYGDADELVPHPYVEAFLDRAEKIAPVSRELFPGSGHVRHFSGHRTRYVEVMRAALARSPEIP